MKKELDHPPIFASPPENIANEIALLSRQGGEICGSGNLVPNVLRLDRNAAMDYKFHK